MSVLHGFSWVNGIWSLLLFGLVIVKIYRLRLAIEHLAEALPKIGSEFIQDEVRGLNRELDETRARIMMLEDYLGLDGGRK